MTLLPSAPCRRLMPLALAVALFCGHAAAEQRSLSQGWLFQKGAGLDRGAERAAFDDSGWRKVAVPHDFAIMDKVDGTPPFDANATGGQDSGYLPGGQGWYRKHLALDGADAARVLRLNFEAVYMDADIWFN